jgi:hypothetical protein
MGVQSISASIITSSGPDKFDLHQPRPNGISIRLYWAMPKGCKKLKRLFFAGCINTLGHRQRGQRAAHVGHLELSGLRGQLHPLSSIIRADTLILLEIT